MRKFRSVLVFSMFATAGSGMVSAQTPEQQVTRVVEALATLSVAKDLAGLDTLYSPDAGVRVIEGAGVNKGWADYRDHHLGPELKEMKNFRSRYYDVEPQVRGNVAWASFRYELGVDTPRGPAESEGRGTAVLENRNGRWLVVHLHTSGRRKVPVP